MYEPKAYLFFPWACGASKNTKTGCNNKTNVLSAEITIIASLKPMTTAPLSLLLGMFLRSSSSVKKAK